MRAADAYGDTTGAAGHYERTAGYRRDRVVLVFAVLSVVVSVGARVWYRAGNVPGWDYLLAAQGQYLISGVGWWGAVRETFVETRHFWLPPAAYSLPYGLLPGALNILTPWLYWQHLVVFSLWLVTLALLLSASGWSLTSARGVGLLLLAWGAWPAGLSYAVQGYPWASCVLAYSVALFVVLHPRVRASVALTILGAAVTYEIPWHSYELAKTVGCVFVLAAFVERTAPRSIRVVWAVAAALQLADAYWLHETTNVMVFRKGNVAAGVGIQHAFSRLPEGAALLFRRVFIEHDIALPVLTTAGAASLLFVREHRAFLAALWLTQVGLVLMLSASGADQAGTQLDLLRSRRYLLIEAVSVLIILIASRTARARPYHVALLGILLIGNLWSLEHLRRFMRNPAYPVRMPSGGLMYLRFSLPAVESVESVAALDPANLAWAERLVTRAKTGERIVLLHSQDCPSENFTNPGGILERLYLTLGHRRFTEQVVAFPGPRCRYVCLPLPTTDTVRNQLAGLPAGTVVELDGTCAEKMREERAFLETHFNVVTLNPGDRYARFELTPKSSETADDP